MAISFPADTVPLHADSQGVVRVGATRVTLDTVVSAFLEGASAEEIVQQYPSLDLADVYQVIAHYLRHTAEIDEHLRQRRDVAEAVRRENEARFDPQGIRDRLLARRNADRQ
ncbi:MAG: DUF433 domain-containing protein [Planctomycetaceae bacterium]